MFPRKYYLARETKIITHLKQYEINVNKSAQATVSIKHILWDKVFSYESLRRETSAG
jgi:hypothetical protein